MGEKEGKRRFSHSDWHAWHEYQEILDVLLVFTTGKGDERMNEPATGSPFKDHGDRIALVGFVSSIRISISTRKMLELCVAECLQRGFLVSLPARSQWSPMPFFVPGSRRSGGHGCRLMQGKLLVVAPGLSEDVEGSPGLQEILLVRLFLAISCSTGGG